MTSSTKHTNDDSNDSISTPKIKNTCPIVSTIVSIEFLLEAEISWPCQYSETLSYCPLSKDFILALENTGTKGEFFVKIR